jgi:hypothetical protein
MFASSFAMLYKFSQKIINWNNFRRRRANSKGINEIKIIK